MSSHWRARKASGLTFAQATILLGFLALCCGALGGVIGILIELLLRKLGVFS